MSRAAWSRFLEYAARARSKPAFDLEERGWKLEVAGRLQSLLASPTADAGWVAQVVEALNRPRLPHLTAIRQREWLRSWGASDVESLRRALDCFADPALDPVNRLARFVDRADRAERFDNAHLSSIVTVGAAFNFATAPASLPLVRPGVFDRFRDLVGATTDGGAESAAALYGEALAFAREVRARLEAAGIPVRDMIDVQSLIEIGLQEAALWTVDPPSDWLERARRPLPSGTAYLAVCALFRNEARYLREWIEFHRLTGAERFFLYNNASTDEYLDVLAPYLEEGVAVLRDWPAAVPDQRDVFDDCLRRHRHDARWIAFIDIDEFLFSPTGERLDTVLAEYEESPGVAVEWAMFSVSGRRPSASDLVIESYPLRDTAELGHLKSIVDPLRTVRCESAHWFGFEYGLPVDENGWPVGLPGTKATSFDRLRVNHYASRSEEELREKIARQSGWVHLRRWRERDLRGELELVHDDAIARWVPKLRASLERSGALR